MNVRHLLRSHPGLNTAIGITFAVISGLLLLGYISNLFRRNDGGPLCRVPVAGREIGPGMLIGAEMLATRDIPRDYLVPGTVLDARDIKGKRALRLIMKGEPFTPSAIPAGRGRETLASRIPSELRAYSLTLGRSSGAGPDLRPGDRVDVLSTGGDPPATRTILRGKLVIGVAGSPESDDEGEATYDPVRTTLLLAPAEVELLAQARYEGEISISLCPVRE